MVQGRYLENGKSVKVLVSFSKQRRPDLHIIPGIWQLEAYSPEDIEPVEIT
jgi:hypothetical protein